MWTDSNGSLLLNIRNWWPRLVLAAVVVLLLAGMSVRSFAQSTPFPSSVPALSFPSPGSNVNGNGNPGITGGTPLASGGSSPSSVIPKQPPATVPTFRATPENVPRVDSLAPPVKSPMSGGPANRQKSNPVPAGNEKIKSPVSRAATNSNATVVPVPENNVFAPLVRVPNPAQSSIVGKAWNLNQFLQPNLTGQQRYERIVDWWALTEKLAIYNLWLIQAQDVQLCIDRYPQNAIPQNVLPLLVSMQQVAIQRLKSAELSFVEAQFAFGGKYPEFRASILEASQIKSEAARKTFLASRLPIPTDVPTTAPYNTRERELARVRALPDPAKKLGVLLPIQYDVVQARITQSNQAYASLKALYNKQGVADEILFGALDRAAQAKLEMIQAILEYNRMIASYSALTVARAVRGAAFLATLNQRYQPQSRQNIIDPSRPTSIRPVGYDEAIPRANRTSGEPVSRNDGAISTREPSSLPMAFPRSSSSVNGTSKKELAPPPSLTDPSPRAFPLKTPEERPLQKKQGNDSNLIIRGQAPNPSGSSLAEVPALTVQQRNTIHEIVKLLFPIKTDKTGAGTSPILEIPLTLRNALEPLQDSRVRDQVVVQYWELRTRIAEMEIEKGCRLSLQLMNDSLVRQFGAAASNPGSEESILLGAWKTALLGADARIAELKLDVRDGQIALMAAMGRTTDNGWPIPVTLPYWGPSYRLETGNARKDSFELLTELVLIPEKLRGVHQFALSMGNPDALFLPELGPFQSAKDGWSWLKILDNKKTAAISFVRLVCSLNLSIARYVAHFTETPIPNDIFANSLIGPEK